MNSLHFLNRSVSNLFELVVTIPTQLVEEINALPSNLREQMLDFIAFLKIKAQKQALLQKQSNIGKEVTAAPENLDELR